jgi:hypothetical protein
LALDAAHRCGALLHLKHSNSSSSRSSVYSTIEALIRVTTPTTAHEKREKKSCSLREENLAGRLFKESRPNILVPALQKPLICTAETSQSSN